MSERRSENVMIVVWLLASLLGCLFSMQFLQASLVNGEYIPVGNDALYHARRIIDAAVSERGFYQFDNTIHVPEGSWLTWPWGYDFIMAQVLKLGLWLSPESRPMAILAHVPVAWILVNFALFTLLARSIGLSVAMTSVALLGFALSPLNQLLHGVGAIDHHFMELTFVLLSTWSGVRFFSNPANKSAAIQLGLALGLAPVMHNSLFLLQLPAVVAAAILWLRADKRAITQALPFAIALLGSSLLILLPSQPFQQFFVEFTTLSWFHLYVAFCTATAFVLMSRLKHSSRNLVILLVVLVVLGAPLALPVLVGTNYLAGDQIGLGVITEVASPLQMWISEGSHLGATRYYSFLLLLAPVLIGLFGWRLYSKPPARETFLAVAAIFGIALLLTQFRMHVFGAWALLLGSLYWLDKLLSEKRVSMTNGTAIAAGLVLVSFQPAIQHQLFERLLPGLAREYAVVQALFSDLEDACAQQPGTVLAIPDDGHPIRYHSECSVIANNFLLTRQHGEKVLEAMALLAKSPEELLEEPSGVQYVLVHIHDIYQVTPQGPTATPISELRRSSPALFTALAIDQNVPPDFELLAELRVPEGDSRNIAYAQLYRINRRD